MSVKNLLLNIRNDLQALANNEIKAAAQRYFKEPIELYGIKAAEVNSTYRKYAKEVKSLTKNEVFELCETLWISGLFEECILACHFTDSMHKKFIPEDFQIFERWIQNYINNWATCDTFCNHTIGNFIMMYPEFISKLKQWTSSENRWVKRASAVSLIVPGKKGLFLEDILEIATSLLTDPDDMVQKGYGWMLKVACNNHETIIFNFVYDHRQEMPRTALRYAIEKMPNDLKEMAMRK
jgi:3-methyladenine DNA glycosylase AlkD